MSLIEVSIKKTPPDNREVPYAVKSAYYYLVSLRYTYNSDVSSWFYNKVKKFKKIVDNGYVTKYILDYSLIPSKQVGNVRKGIFE